MPIAGKSKKEIVKMEMKKFGQGKLHSSSGKKVTDKKQALAIGYSEGKHAKKK